MLPEHVLIEMPFIQEMIEKARTETLLKSSRRSICLAIRGRFGAIPKDLDVQLASIESLERLDELTEFAGSCSDLTEFRQAVLRPFASK